ncbi:MAG: sensor histidine kinase [Tissierellales bacterium]
MYKDKTRFLIMLYISFCLILSIFISFSYAEIVDKPMAINGELDLTHWNLKQDGIVTLDGQWEFYWEELYTPEDFEEVDTITNRKLITLPRTWNKLILDTHQLPGKGYATYRLVVHHNSNEILGIKMPRIFTSYNLWVNGELIASAGKVGKNMNQAIPQYLPQVRYIRPEAGTIEFVVQVSNFRHRSGGILESIQLGTESQISETRISNLTFEIFLFGSLFIIGFYHVILFIYRTKDKSTLYFGIYSLLISFRTLLVGEIYFIHLFQNFSWEIAHKVQTLAYYLGVLLVFLFIRETFPKDVNEKVHTFFRAFTSVFVILVLLTPARIFTIFNPIYQIYTIIVILYLIYIIAIAFYKKREGSYIIGFGLIILILTALNDILFLSVLFADSDNLPLKNFINRGNLSSWGLLIFTFSQSIVIAKKFSKTFSKVELLSVELKNANTGLEEKVRERTLALEASKEELLKSYEAVSRSEKSLEDFTQKITHDLRTPLSAIRGYTNMILDGIVVEPIQEQKYLRRIIDKVDFLSHLVQELLDLSQLQSRQLKLNTTQVSLTQFINGFCEKYKFDMGNKNIAFSTHSLTDSQESYVSDNSLYLVVDTQRLDRVFGNLVNNALKYTPEGGSIGLHFSLSDNCNELIVKVSDTGMGIPKEDLNHVFERFYMVSKARQATNSSGLGLSIVKEIVEYHGGKVWVESEVNKGSSFFFTLPIYDNKSNSSNYR